MVKKSLFFFGVLCTGLYASNQKDCFPGWWSGATNEVFGTVDTSCQLCPEERAYIEGRQSAVTRAMCTFLGVESISNCPAVACCFSGGAYRAMISSLGCLEGIEEIGLLGATKYISTLSGSTWMLAHLLLRMQREGINIKQFREKLQQRVSRTFFDASNFDAEAIKNEIFKIIKDRLIVEPADIWGMIIADKLFDDLQNAQGITFSDLRSFLTSGNYSMPFPLFSLIISDAYPYEWLDVNPFIMGSDYLGAYIPTAQFDSYFKNGSCYKLLQEKSLGWFLGMFGSAYNLSFGDLFILLAKAIGNDAIVHIMSKIVDAIDLTEVRPITSLVNNFVRDMPGVPLAERDNTEVSDAGIDFNVPVPLVLRENRMADVLLVLDASSDVDPNHCHELQYAAEYAKRKGIKFPSMDNPVRIAENVVLFENTSDKTVPTVLYFTIPVQASTFDFDYTKEEFDVMCDGMKNIVIASKETIKEVIKRKIS